jgi:hypothetical protein
MKSFFMDGEACRFYSRIRSEHALAHIRSRLEELYSRYSRYADTNFKRDARKHLQQRYWEMLSCVTLLERGFPVEKLGNHGMDFFSGKGSSSIWFEAVCATAGDPERPGHFPRLEAGECQTFDEELFILRITSTLRGKLKKINEKDAPQINESDAIVILLNSGSVFDGWLPMLSDANGIPLFAKAILPIGPAAAPLDVSTDTLGPTVNFPRSSLLKKNNEKVSTKFFDIFDTPGADRISAVIHSKLRVQDDPYPLGEDFVLVRNENARNPLPESCFQWCKEFPWR